MLCVCVSPNSTPLRILVVSCTYNNINSGVHIVIVQLTVSLEISVGIGVMFDESIRWILRRDNPYFSFRHLWYLHLTLNLDNMWVKFQCSTFRNGVHFGVDERASHPTNKEAKYLTPTIVAKHKAPYSLFYPKSSSVRRIFLPPVPFTYVPGQVHPSVQQAITGDNILAYAIRTSHCIEYRIRIRIRAMPSGYVLQLSPKTKFKDSQTFLSRIRKILLSLIIYLYVSIIFIL